jgi:hypothetical protein
MRCTESEAVKRAGRPGRQSDHRNAIAIKGASELRLAAGRICDGDRSPASGQHPGAGCGSGRFTRLRGGPRGDDRERVLRLTASCQTAAAVRVAGGGAFDGNGNAIRLVHPASGSFSGAKLIGEGPGVTVLDLETNGTMLDGA